MDDMLIFLEINGKKLMLPVLPGEITVDVPSRNENNDVVKLGEITQLSKKGLREITFSSFFPLRKTSSMVKGASLMAPQSYVDEIEKGKDSGKPSRLIITQTSINTLVSIEDFSWSYTDPTGDIEYTISLKEYKEYNPKYIKTVQKPVVRAPKRPAASNQPITIGCTVIVNGRLHRDSYGSGPGQTEVNAKRRVSHIVRKPRSNQPFTIHVTTLSGGWRGWVRPSEVRRI